MKYMQGVACLCIEHLIDMEEIHECGHTIRTVSWIRLLLRVIGIHQELLCLVLIHDEHQFIITVRSTEPSQICANGT